MIQQQLKAESIKVVNCRGRTADQQPDYFAYCGRTWAGFAGSPLANRFKATDERRRDWACDSYDLDLKHRINAGEAAVIAELNRLHALWLKCGRLELGCWCAPKRCHCDSIKARLLRWNDQGLRPAAVLGGTCD